MESTAAASSGTDARLIIVTSILIVALAFVSVMMGPAEISPGKACHHSRQPAARGSRTSIPHPIVMNLRPPHPQRIGSRSGTSRQWCGIQSVFRNPMADPCPRHIVRGVVRRSAHRLGHDPCLVPWDSQSAHGSAMATAVLIMFLAGGGGWSKTSLLLTGVAMNYLLADHVKPA